MATPEEIAKKYGGVIVGPDPEAVAKKYGGQFSSSTDPGSARQEEPRRSGGQRVLDYTTETLSNVPSSAAGFAGNLGTALIHPIDTAANLGKVATGTLQNMTPGYVTPQRPEYSAEANAVGAGLKSRYGSLDAIKNTIKADPVGAAADASVVLGGVSGLARGAGAAANLARLPRAAGVAGDVSRAAATASDVINPLTLPLQAVGAGARRVARPLIKSALGLPGKAERHGANPAKAALEETSGIRPSTVKASAIKRLDDLNAELEALVNASGNTGDLTAARSVIADAIAKVKAANGLADDLTPMLDQLTEARPGFAGAVTPTGDVAAQQAPSVILPMKRQFGEDFTKFDAAVPLKNSARKVGNQAYHELSTELNRAVPGAEPLNKLMQGLVPVKEGAQRAEEHVGAVQRGVDRATRPTGALAATALGFHAGGPLGAIGVMTVQEALASPAIRMALARALHGTGTGLAIPAVRRAGTTAAVVGGAENGLLEPTRTTTPPLLR